MKIYFNVGFGMITKCFMVIKPDILIRIAMVTHMQQFICCRNSYYILDRNKYLIYLFKKLGDQT